MNLHSDLYTLLYIKITSKGIATALTGVAQLVGHHPAKQNVASLMAGLGCGFGPRWGHV